MAPLKFTEKKWHDKVPDDPTEYPPCPNETLQHLYQEAQNILTSDIAAYEEKLNKVFEKRWMRTLMTRGTNRDKVASYTLMIQEEPLYNLKALESLIGLVKPAKTDCITCINALLELFLSNLLCPNRKLKKFAEHPLLLLDELSSGNHTVRRHRLVAWLFEDQLKTLYRDFIESLQRIVKEGVEATKEKAIGALGKLLQSHPEQEALLLTYLVNKLGDPNKRVASKAMHCLSTTLQQHPNMKMVVMNEVEKLLFRPNVGQKARYYGVCFLAQMMFCRKDSQLAANIIKLYFSFFRACIKQGDIDSHLLRVLLMGVNRAYPYARDAMDSISDQLETLYKVVHLAPFNIALHALCLLFQVADYKNSVSDRFYSVLYRILLNPSATQSSHFAIFLNLLYRALKKDESIPRVRAFVKRLLQVCCFLPVPSICGSLFTLSHVIRSRKVVALFHLDKPSKEIMIQSEKTSTSPEISDDDSGNERYEDVILVEQGAPVTESRRDAVPAPWDHKKNLNKKIKGNRDHGNGYDPMQRNPMFAHGELCCYSELCLLATHFHPTVALFASQILRGEFVTYSGDPLKDFTLTSFLERFTFRNPKKQPQETQSSVFAKRQCYTSRGLKGFPITSKAYINQQEEKIPIDERYLFRFLKERRERLGKSDDDGSDVESVGSDEFEEMMDGLMRKRGLKADVDEDLDEEDFNVDFADDYNKNVSTSKKRKGREVEDGDASFSDDEGSTSCDDFDNDDLDEDDKWNSEEEYLHSSNERKLIKDKAQRRKSTFDNHTEGSQSEDDDDLSGIENDIEGLSDFDDMEDIEFDEESEEESFTSKKGKRNDDWESSTFVPTEEFAELLEAADNAKQSGSGALSNKDKAGEKQLAWEVDRDRWLKGQKRTRGMKRSFSQFNIKGDGSKAKMEKKPFKSRKTIIKRKKK